MSSKDHSDDLPIERDLPTTEADIAALRQISGPQEIPFAEILELLTGFNLFPRALPSRPLATGREPFEL